MNKRKILTIIIVAIVLVATIFWVAMKVINNKKNVSISTSSQPKNSSNMFNVKNDNNAKIIKITGSVKEITEKTMTITTAKGDVTIGINGATPVMLSADKNVQPTIGQIADVRLNDSVDAQYDQDTKEAHLITIIQKASDKAAAATSAAAASAKK